jgi:hypothetical protein
MPRIFQAPRRWGGFSLGGVCCDGPGAEPAGEPDARAFCRVWAARASAKTTVLPVVGVALAVVRAAPAPASVAMPPPEEVPPPVVSVVAPPVRGAAPPGGTLDGVRPTPSLTTRIRSRRKVRSSFQRWQCPRT